MRGLRRERALGTADTTLDLIVMIFTYKKLIEIYIKKGGYFSENG